MSRHKILRKVLINVILYAQILKASMRTTLIDGRFWLLNPLSVWQFAHPGKFNDHTHSHRCMLYIERNPLHDVPNKKIFDKINIDKQ